VPIKRKEVTVPLPDPASRLQGIFILALIQYK